MLQKQWKLYTSICLLLLIAGCESRDDGAGAIRNATFDVALYCETSFLKTTPDEFQFTDLDWSQYGTSVESRPSKGIVLIANNHRIQVDYVSTGGGSAIFIQGRNTMGVVIAVYVVILDDNGKSYIENLRPIRVSG